MNQKITSKFFTESKKFGTLKWEPNVENAIEETVKILVENPEIFLEKYLPVCPLTKPEKITTLISLIKTKIIKGEN